MMKRCLFVACCAMIASAYSQGIVMKKNHVPEKLPDDIAKFNPRSAERGYIALVNVGKAVPENEWALSSTFAASRLQLNIWTNSLPGIVPSQLLGDAGAVQKLLGTENAKVAVFVVDRKDLPPLLSAPGLWSVVNMRNLASDKPDAQTIRDRYSKMILKGIAAAAGGGATLEPLCSNFYGSNTIKGMDETSILLSPMCYFPMLEILRERGGVDLVTPQRVADAQ